MVKNLPAVQETWVQSLGQEELLEKGMTTCSRILAWRIPWPRSLVGAIAHGGCKESDITEQLTLYLRTPKAVLITPPGPHAPPSPPKFFF